MRRREALIVGPESQLDQLLWEVCRLPPHPLTLPWTTPTEVRNVTRKSRQVTVRIHETKEKVTKSPTQLVAHFKNAVHKATGEIVAAHKLPSGDVILITVFSAGRQELKQNDD